MKNVLECTELDVVKWNFYSLILRVPLILRPALQLSTTALYKSFFSIETSHSAVDYFLKSFSYYNFFLQLKKSFRDELNHEYH